MSSGNLIQRFYFTHSGIRGHWVSLSGVLQELQARRAYPDNVATLLGELLAAVAMVADGLKWPGSIALQAKMPGALRTLVAEYRPPNGLRAIARSATGELNAAELAQLSQSQLLQGGQLAVSLLPGDDQPNLQPYQGLIDLTDGTLAANLETYFANSEQVPTLLRLAAANPLTNASTTLGDHPPQQAAGLLLQRLPNNAKDPWDADKEDLAWARLQAQLTDLPTQALLASVSAGTPEPLLRNFVAIDDVKLAPSRELQFTCTCNREKTANILRTVPKDELVALLEEQETIDVTCEFCGQVYGYTALDTHLLVTPDSALKPH